MNVNKIIWAVIAARSGSKSLKNKNIKNLSGKPLLSHTVTFAKKTNLFEKILLSTDSNNYAKIGKKYGAWVPFLRNSRASKDNSMEEDVLFDIDKNLSKYNIAPPDIIVWLRPTFPFRSAKDLINAIKLLDKKTDSVRLVTSGEPRLYKSNNGYLTPIFDDKKKSMVRRQSLPETFQVFHTDIFWYKNISLGSKFLGKKIKFMKIHKICSMDIDNIEDFEIIECLIKSNSKLIKKFINE